MKNLKTKLNKILAKAYLTMRSTSGDFVVDHAVVFVIIIVLGALGLMLLKNFLNDTMAPTVEEKILDFFN